MNNSSFLVRGIGIKGMECPTQSNRKHLKEYKLWSGMLERCTEACWVKNTSYVGCNVSDNFKYYTYFYHWCQTQVGFKNKDENGDYWQLDKDLLVKGNKLYSEDTCVFLPRKLNGLFVNCNTVRGSSPLGVYFEKESGKFKVRCAGVDGNRVYLGRFTVERLAFETYKSFKETVVKQLAEKYKDQLDQRAYQALINYEVNIND